MAIVKLDKRRKNALRNLKRRARNILKKLGWTEEYLYMDRNNKLRALKKREEKANRPPQPIATFPRGDWNATASIILDTSKLRELLQDDTVEAPQNFDQLQANFTREQKLLMFNYVVEKTKDKMKVQTEEFPQDRSGVLTQDINAEQFKMEKTRKRKYRVSRPTHREQIRSLVEVQMQAITENISGGVDLGEKSIETMINPKVEKDSGTKDKEGQSGHKHKSSKKDRHDRSQKRHKRERKSTAKKSKRKDKNKEKVKVNKRKRKEYKSETE